MTLNRIIGIADEMYATGLVEACFDNPKLEYGDWLAKDIVVRLTEAYDENNTDIEQLVAALKTMRRALHKLQAVADEFERRLYE